MIEPVRLRSLVPTLVLGLAAGTVLSAQAQRTSRPSERRPATTKDASQDHWQWLVHDGCQFAVPVSWRDAPDKDKVTAPDGANLSVRRFRILDWLMHKAQIRATFISLNRVHDDSDHRFWFEIGDKSTTTHYIAVREGSTACIGLLQIRAAALPANDDTVEKIAANIGPLSSH